MILLRCRAWIAFSVLPLLASCSPGSYGGKSDDEKGNKSEETPALLVRTAKPSRRTMNHTLKITGEATPTLQGEVNARISGVRVSEVLKDVGGRVEKGESMARLETLQLAQSVAEAKAALAESGVKVREVEGSILELAAELKSHERTIVRAQQTMDRVRQQFSKGAISEEEKENAEYSHEKEIGHKERLEMQVAKAHISKDVSEKARERAVLVLAKAEQDFLDADVKAPIAGIITERQARPGQQVSQGTPLFRLYDPESMVVETYLPQRELRSVSPKQRVRVQSDAIPDLTFVLEVALLGPVVEKEIGMVMVRLAVDREATIALEENKKTLANSQLLTERLMSHTLLRPGLFFSGEIILETRQDVLTVPRKAIGYSRGTPYVYAVVEGVPASGADATKPPEGKSLTVRRVFFEEGLSSEGHVEFIPKDPKNKLSTDDEIVEVGHDRLRDGDPIRKALPDAPKVIEEGAAPASSQR